MFRLPACVFSRGGDSPRRLSERGLDSETGFGLGIFARLLEFIAGLPSRELRELSRLPAESKTEPGHSGIAGKIHFRPIFVRRLMVAVGDVVFFLVLASGQIVTFEERTFIHAERRNPDSREAEMIGPIVMTGFRTIIGLNAQLKIFGHLLYER